MREVRGWSHRRSWGPTLPGCQFNTEHLGWAGTGRWCEVVPAWRTTSSRHRRGPRKHWWRWRGQMGNTQMGKKGERSLLPGPTL